MNILTREEFLAYCRTCRDNLQHIRRVRENVERCPKCKQPVTLFYGRHQKKWSIQSHSHGCPMCDDFDWHATEQEAWDAFKRKEHNGAVLLSEVRPPVQPHEVEVGTDGDAGGDRETDSDCPF